MIISHKHRYLFVQLAHTASTAVARELCEHYDGEPILRKHTFYHQFCAQASQDERSYFTFSTIRNPIEDVVSVYYKYKTNHERYDDPENAVDQGGFVTPRMRRRFDWTQRMGADFDSYFRRFYRVPYDNWSRLDHERFDYVMRYEQLQDDFAAVLRRLGIEPVRPIPAVNVTRRSGGDALSHFEGSAGKRANWVFGPFLERWGYEIPAAWGARSASKASRLAYRLAGVARTFRWRHM